MAVGTPWYKIAANGTIQINLLYDHERSSPNRAAGHFHFQLHARPGAKLTLEFNNLDNVWNSQLSSIAKELKAAVISENGRDWTPVPLETFGENRIRSRRPAANLKRVHRSNTIRPLQTPNPIFQDTPGRTENLRSARQNLSKRF